MKKNSFLFAAALALTFAGCSDDKMIDEGRIPVDSGDEIMFGSTLNGDHNVVGLDGVDTRTIYGERNQSGIPVNWVDGDEVAIFCPQASAPANHLVNYKVKPNDLHPNQSSTIVKVDPNQAGLQWGNEDIHEFFGLYPASIVKATDKDDQAGYITANLPVTQNPIKWRKEQDKVTGLMTYRGEPDMKHAFMFAYSVEKKSEMTKDKTVHLDFKNLVTVLDITIPGPDTPVKLSQITVGAAAGSNPSLVGNFRIKVNESATDPNHNAECYPLNDGTVTNRVAISCYDPETGEMLEIGPGEAINVKAFIIPDNHATESDNTYRQFRVSVTSLNSGTKMITLNKGEGQEINKVIEPHKINRVLLPKLDFSGGKPSNWMAALDPNIYLSELSIPGSKFSYLTSDNGANPAFQFKDIKGQFQDGVRAFIVQTGSQTTYKVTRTGRPFDYNYNYERISTQMPIVGFGNTSKYKLENAVSDIASELKTAQSEFAVIVLTCNPIDVKDHIYKKDYIGGIGDGVASEGWQQNWIEAVKYRLEDLKKAGYPIYTDPITPETTLNDVQGQIIFKVNYNDSNQNKYLAETDTVPALFSLWEAPGNPYKVLKPALYWGTFNNNGPKPQLEWMYQEVSYVPKEASEAAKEDGVKTIFKESVKAYQNNDRHNIWYMNDLGGAYMNENGSFQDNPVTRLTEKFNKIGIEALQTRGENASTGLVFINFADRDPNHGGLYKSDYILSTIIDNNFKFALRKKGSN